ncbi:hypothetical protein ACBY01_15135 [Sphingomonas sp. ac-8]|uniref:hypothetical protein n=1 Tax=Sphingomonas sp. ac-8 TaxID=3242977 RepID=UPI003A80F885
MTSRYANSLIWLLVIAAYLARPWSCMAALQLEVRPPDNPYGSVDPHGFGVLGAMITALVLIGPVLWLLLQRRPDDVAKMVPARRVVAVMLVVATPMLLQLTYLRMPLAWCWPVIVTSGIWAAVALALCLRTAPGALSVHGAFDRFPRIAWSLVAAIGLGKIALLGSALA